MPMQPGVAWTVRGTHPRAVECRRWVPCAPCRETAGAKGGQPVATCLGGRALGGPDVGLKVSIGLSVSEPSLWPL